MKPVLILTRDPDLRTYLGDMLAQQGFESCRIDDPENVQDMPEEGAVFWLGAAAENPPPHIQMPENNIFRLPVRAGALIDQVRRCYSAMRADTAKQIKIGPYILDTVESCLESADAANVIRLTEKERDILEFLAENGPVGREALLKEIWGYAEGLETHTIETHIYRLRQKMEKDPAVPEILLTDDEGYRLKS